MTESDVGNTASQREGDDDQPADDENVFVGKLEGHNFKNMIRILKSVVIRKVNLRIRKKMDQPDSSDWFVVAAVDWLLDWLTDWEMTFQNGLNDWIDFVDGG